MANELLGIAKADGSAITLTVSSIPQTHKDLEIFFTGTINYTGSTFYTDDFFVNTVDTNANYDIQRIAWYNAGGSYTNNAVASGHGYSNAANYCPSMGITDTGQGGGNGNWMTVYLPEYTDTSGYQQILYECGGIKNSNAWAASWGTAYKYGETAATTSVSVKNSGNHIYQAGSSLLVYGIDRTV